MPAYSNRESETGHVGGYGTKPVSGTGRNHNELSRQTQFAKDFSQSAALLGFTGELTNGHGSYLAGCLAYKESGYCLSKIERYRHRITSASPLTPAFKTTQELIKYLQSQFSEALVDDENSLTEVGAAIWSAFESRSEPDNYLNLLAQIAKINFDLWWGWTHEGG